MTCRFTGIAHGLQGRADPHLQQEGRRAAQHGPLPGAADASQRAAAGRLAGGSEHGRRRAGHGEHPEDRLPQRQSKSRSMRWRVTIWGGLQFSSSQTFPRRGPTNGFQCQAVTLKIQTDHFYFKISNLKNHTKHTFVLFVHNFIFLTFWEKRPTSKRFYFLQF